MTWYVLKTDLQLKIRVGIRITITTVRRAWCAGGGGDITRRQPSRGHVPLESPLRQCGRPVSLISNGSLSFNARARIFIMVNATAYIATGAALLCRRNGVFRKRFSPSLCVSPSPPSHDECARYTFLFQFVLGIFSSGRCRAERVGPIRIKRNEISSDSKHCSNVCAPPPPVIGKPRRGTHIYVHVYTRKNRRRRKNKHDDDLTPRRRPRPTDVPLTGEKNAEILCSLCCSS